MTVPLRDSGRFIPSRVRLAAVFADLLVGSRELLALADEIRHFDPALAARVALFARSIYDRSDALMSEITE